MKKDIVKFLRHLKDKYGLESVYFPAKDIYSIRYRGRGIQNFTSKIFYTLPKRHRENLIYAIFKKGLTHNLGQRDLKDRLFLDRSIGKIIK